MKFSEMTYKRPDTERLEAEFTLLLQTMRDTASFEELNMAIQTFNRLRSNYETMEALVYLKHYGDFSHAFFNNEFNELSAFDPIYTGIKSAFYQTLLESPFRLELEKKYGKQLFALAESTIKTYKDEIKEDLLEESKLVAEYRKLMNSVEVVFDYQRMGLGQLAPFLVAEDRDTRRRAHQARFDAMGHLEPSLNHVFDQLVKVRTRMAKKLGYENFIELGYAKLNRSDTNAEMVASFREQAASLFVPFVTELLEKQRLRLGLIELKYYDERVFFKTGDPVLKISSVKEMVEATQFMFEEMSPETADFFTFMSENELLDLEGRDNNSGVDLSTTLGITNLLLFLLI